ncbi:hypothetical protein HBH89_248560, partial [Parastagonospora nodorum]
MGAILPGRQTAPESEAECMQRGQWRKCCVARGQSACEAVSSAITESCTCPRVVPSLARHPSFRFQHDTARSQPHSANMLPDEIIAQLNTEFQCREQQIQQLAALYT